MSRNGRVPGWVVLLDIVTIIVAFLAGYWVRYDLRWFLDVAYDAPLSAYLPFLILYVILTPVFFVVDGVYRTWPRSWMDQVYRITNATAKVTVLMLAVTFVFRPRYYSRVMLVEVGLLTIGLLALVRGAEGLAIAYLRRRGGRHQTGRHRRRRGDWADRHAHHRRPPGPGLPRCRLRGR
jgi:FlaA1/EpsC-like NDP-sugar epimerase